MAKKNDYAITVHILRIEIPVLLKRPRADTRPRGGRQGQNGAKGQV